MNPKYQWAEDSYQPGLFTIYFEEKLHLPSPESIKPKSCLKIENKKKIKSEKKITSKYRLKTKQKPVQNIQIPPKLEKQLGQAKKDNSLRVRAASTYQSPFSTLNASARTPRIVKLQKSQLKLKINNINSNFEYDINTSKDKSFIYEEGPANYVRIMSRKQQINAQKYAKLTKSIAQHQKETKLSKAFAQKSINSDQTQKIIFNNKSPFIQLLMKHRMGEAPNIAEKKQRDKNLTLSHFITYNSPFSDQYCHRYKTQK